MCPRVSPRVTDPRVTVRTCDFASRACGLATRGPDRHRRPRPQARAGPRKRTCTHRVQDHRRGLREAPTGPSRLSTGHRPPSRPRTSRDRRRGRPPATGAGVGTCPVPVSPTTSVSPGVGSPSLPAGVSSCAGPVSRVPTPNRPPRSHSRGVGKGGDVEWNSLGLNASFTIPVDISRTHGNRRESTYRRPGSWSSRPGKSTVAHRRSQETWWCPLSG